MHKKIFTFSLFILAMIVGMHGSSVHAAVEEQIKNFSSTITIAPSGRVQVIEQIIYDFGALERHGIFRDIPYEYERSGSKYRLRFTDIGVTKDGKDEPVSVSYSGGMVHLKIGDPDITITGMHEYAINYTVNRAINFFNDSDELYWNVTGNGWQVPIAAVNSEVILSGATPKFTCFVGVMGSKELCNTAVSGSKVTYSSARPLAAGEGLTVVYGFPKGLIAPPTAADRFKDFIIDNVALGVPVIIFFLMFYIWFTHGRDPKGKTTVVPQYDAPLGLSPLEIGVLMDERADRADISAEIIHLAVLGFIKITREEKKKLLVFNSTDYRLDLLKSVDTALTEADVELLKTLFDGKQSALVSDFKDRRSMPQGIQKLKSKVYAKLVSEKYFAANPNVVKAVWIVAGLFTGAIIIAILSAVNRGQGINIVSGIISGIIIIIFGAAMGKRTVKGVEAKAHALGLKEYITVAEKDRLAFHNAPEKTPDRFEKLLPFAMALGVDKAWAKQFEGIYNQNPSWYNDSSGSMFNALVLSHAIGDFSSSMNTAMATSTASSGGSGFSGGGGGGGFGGGGGGSW